ncbi:MAG: DNA-protecting protein DprA [Candidatus Doudnabacteria bacterium]|nr:DNA-protecting protein DprA [Candidatus Doudnabacteria bacterium]
MVAKIPEKVNQETKEETLSAEALAKAEKIYGNAFNLIPDLGPISLMKLQAFFGDYASAWQASGSDLRQAGLNQKSVDAIISKRNEIKPEQSWEKLQSLGIEVVLTGDEDYPPLLSEISQPPPILYIRGNVQLLRQPGLAVVGTRKMTQYGKHITQELVATLAASNLVIVSGLAFGVDAEAHNTTLNSGGSPIAVLASSLDNSSISPRANFLLAQKIIQQGCLVSEYPLGMVVQKQNFPIRNRIISGLSLGTLVIEADLESGALITANYALEQNREVFAVPGSIFSEVSQGTNELIKRGAKLVTSARDIIQELNIDLNLNQAVPLEPTAPEEKVLLELLSKEPTHIDELVRSIKKPAAEVNTLLTMLELKGRVKNLGGSHYVKTR